MKTFWSKPSLVGESGDPSLPSLLPGAFPMVNFFARDLLVSSSSSRDSVFGNGVVKEIGRVKLMDTSSS